MRKYRCKEENSKIYNIYLDKDHISAAKKYALDFIDKIQKNNLKPVNGIKVYVITDDDESYLIEIGFVIIKKN